jgi:hypothetical protein
LVPNRVARLGVFAIWAIIYFGQFYLKIGSRSF